MREGTIKLWIKIHNYYLLKTLLAEEHNFSEVCESFQVRKARFRLLPALALHFITRRCIVWICLNLRTKVAAPLGRHVKGLCHCRRWAADSLFTEANLTKRERRSGERQADVGMGHYIRPVKKLIWLKWHKLLKRGISSARFQRRQSSKQAFWSPAIKDCHRSRDDEKGRL